MMMTVFLSNVPKTSLTPRAPPKIHSNDSNSVNGGTVTNEVKKIITKEELNSNDDFNRQASTGNNLLGMSTFMKGIHDLLDFSE